MKSNELRINNLTSAGIVIEIQKECFYVHDGKSSLKNTWFDINPIKITEEWLLKFGFEKFVYESEETGYGTEYKLKASEDVFMVYADDFSLGIYSDEISEQNDVAVIPNHEHIKHVHQLQNLYFALTGEELNYESYN